MKTLKIKAYSVDELSEEAREKVLHDHRFINVEYDGWYNPIFEGAKEDLLEMGFNGVEIFFSGFGSQGDGACFTAESIDLEKFREKGTDLSKIEIDFDNISANVKRIYSRYTHENTVRANIEYNEDEFTEEQLDFLFDLEEYLADYVKRKSKQIYITLETYHNEETTDEAVIETLNINEYLFFENGKQISGNMEIEEQENNSTPESRAKEAAKVLFDALNDMGFDQETFINEVLSQHPTLKQNFFRLVYATIFEFGVIPRTKIHVGCEAAHCVATHIVHHLDQSFITNLHYPNDRNVVGKDWTFLPKL